MASSIMSALPLNTKPQPGRKRPEQDGPITDPCYRRRPAASIMMRYCDPKVDFVRVQFNYESNNTVEKPGKYRVT